MSMSLPFLIKPIESINPLQDNYWVSDGENMWFLPCVLDLIHNTYSGYWYGTKHIMEGKHYHTGIAQGTILYGQMILVCNNKDSILKPQDGFLLPPDMIHSADIIPDERGFLIFGIIVGTTHYLNSNESLDAKSYYDLVNNHYLKHNLTLERIAINKSK